MAKKFDENSRVKIPAIVHLTRLNYRYVSYKAVESFIDRDTNIYRKSFQVDLNQINQSEFGSPEIDSIIFELRNFLNAEDLWRKFFEKLQASLIFNGENILRWNEKLVDGRNIFLNTGGNAGINFYVGAAAYSTDTWNITAENLADYLYLFLDTIKIEIGKKFFKGTTLKHLQKDLLRAREIYIPTAAELEEFNRVVVPSFTMISKNLRENYRLAEMRNFLLPLLMNGQVGLKEE